jgi:hypothetical protein
MRGESIIDKIVAYMTPREEGATEYDISHEDFMERESLKQLPREHFFHPECA